MTKKKDSHAHKKKPILVGIQRFQMDSIEKYLTLASFKRSLSSKEGITFLKSMEGSLNLLHLPIIELPSKVREPPNQTPHPPHGKQRGNKEQRAYTTFGTKNLPFLSDFFLQTGPITSLVSCVNQPSHSCRHLKVHIWFHLWQIRSEVEWINSTIQWGNKLA